MRLKHSPFRVLIWAIVSSLSLLALFFLLLPTPRPDSSSGSNAAVTPLSPAGQLKQVVQSPDKKAGDSQEPLPNLDVRQQDKGTSEVMLPQARIAALAKLKQQVPGLAVEFDAVTKSPKWLGSNGGFLTGAQKPIAGQDADAPIRTFIDAHRTLFGHDSTALDQARRITDYTTARSNSRKVVWHQQLDGIDIFEAVFQANLTANAELINVGSHLMADPEAAFSQNSERANLIAFPPLSAVQAVAIAGQNVGEKVTVDSVRAVGAPASQADRKQQFRAAMLTDADARLIWVPMSEDRLNLAWDVTVSSRTRAEMYRVLVDAKTGNVLVRHSLTAYISDATYRVYTTDSPAPFSPGHETPSSLQPLEASRVLVTTPALNTTASPNGWINDGETMTIGNNANAYVDADADNIPDTPRTTGTAARVFDFPMNTALEPATYKNASVTQLFYWTNFMHDRLYELGFTEPAGNFQTNNFGRGGAGNDAVLAETQDGSGTNNANFSTPVDGGPGRMQMYIWNGATPARDSTFDTTVMFHEYGHGVSNRLVGGPSVTISALSTRGMGEGWSDFYGMTLLAEAGENPHGNWPAAAYLTKMRSGWLTENYYYGLRRYSYSTDMLKNPLTFKDIDPDKIDLHPNVPYNPTAGATQDATQVHFQGTVWCTILWELRANLVMKHGITVGNERAMFLVTEGMKLGPANPNFVQSRDGIIQAALVNHPADLGEVWSAFAKRGLGHGATAPASSSTAGVNESYKVPDSLEINDRSGWNITGNMGGPFTPATKTLTLSNDGTGTLHWSASSQAGWLNVTPSSGSLTSGATVVVTISSQANQLSAGFHSTNVVFRNTATSFNQPVGIRLYVTPPVAYSFNLSTNPGWTMTGEWAYGTPTGGGGGAGNPDPTSGATGSQVFGVNLSGNHTSTTGGPFYLTSAPMNLSHLKQTRLRFKRWLNVNSLTNNRSTVEVSTDGTTWREIFLNPNSVTDNAWKTMEYDLSSMADQKSSVRVRWGYQKLSSSNAYSGWNIDDIEILGESTNVLSLAFDETVSESSAPIAATVTQSIVQSQATVVNLTSSDPTAATVPATVTIPSGQSSQTFLITPVADTELDGAQSTVIFASSHGLVTTTRTLMVSDDETTTLAFDLPTELTEGSGTATGFVSVLQPPTKNITVMLASTGTRLVIPPSVVIPQGTTGPIPFILSAPNNALAEGPAVITLTASVSGWPTATGTVNLLDDDLPSLTLTGPPQVREGDGHAIYTVTVNTIQTTPLAVTLASSQTNKLLPPQTVIIPSGEFSANFETNIMDDALSDGAQVVNLAATCDGYPTALRAVTVADNEVAHYTFETIASPQSRNNPIRIAIAARDLNGDLITNHTGTIALSSSSASGPVPFTIHSLAPFSQGVSAGSILVPTQVQAMVLSATDTAGKTGSSNPFDVAPVAHDTFHWSTIPPTVAGDTDFTATVTAVNDEGATYTNYHEPTLVELYVYGFDRTVGSTASTTTTSDIYNTAAQDSRCQLLYTAAELGSRPRWLSGLHFSLASAGGQPMQNFTVRIKNTALSHFDAQSNWESEGWTTVHHQESAPATNSTLLFTKPFYYDGSQNILVDVSYDNATSSTAGALRYVASEEQRVLYGTSASNHGSPLTWTAQSGPPVATSNQLPTLTFYEARNAGSIPSSPVSFTSGVGTVTTFAPQGTFWLCATAPSGIHGFSDRSLASGYGLQVGTLSVFTDGFESGTLSSAWNITGNAGTTARTQVTSQNTPQSGSFHMTMDTTSTAAGVYARNTPTLSLNLTGRRNVVLSYYSKSFSDEAYGAILTGPLGTFPSATNYDGVAISPDGITWVQVGNYNFGPNYPSFATTVSLDQTIQRMGWSYNSAFKVRFTQFDDQAIPNDGIGIDDVRVTATSPSAVMVDLPPTIEEGASEVPVTVRIPSVRPTAITVTLVSSGPARLTVTPSVTITSGQTTATAYISAPQNQYAEGGRPSGITATAATYTSSFSHIRILDDDLIQLELALPASILEGNLNVPVTVSSNPAMITTLPVFFTSSNPSLLNVNSHATLSAGSDTATFYLSAINNILLEGTQSVDITAFGSGFSETSTAIDVLDNESNQLSLSAPAAINEGDAPATATVSIAATSSRDITVSLSSDPHTKITVPETVLIPAGLTSATFPITPIDNEIRDGTQTVTLSASSPGLQDATAQISVDDNDPVAFEFSQVPSPQKRNGGFPVTIHATDDNGAILTHFHGKATLSALAGALPLPIIPSEPVNFANGIWNGQVQIEAMGSNVTLQATTSDGATGLTNVFDVINAGAATKLAFLPITTPQPASTLIPYQVYAATSEDILTNEFTEPVTVELVFATTNAVLSSTELQLQNGIATGTFFLPSVAGSVYLRANGTTLSGQSSTIAVGPARPSSTPEPATIFEDDFENVVLKPAWALTGTNRWRTIISPLHSPRGSRHLVMDSNLDSYYSRNEATLTLNLAGKSNVNLRFWHKEFTDDDHGPPASPFTNGADFDGVAISANGTQWYEVQPLRGATSTSSYREHLLNLNQLATSKGLTLGNNFKIRFNHYDRNTAPSDGFVFDDILVSGLTMDTLAISLPGMISEGSSNTGTVSLNAARAEDTEILLATDRPANISLPTSITIPAGSTESAPFTISVTEDDYVTGPLTAQVIASTRNGDYKTATLTLEDNDALQQLTLSLPESVTEGGSSSGTITADRPVAADTVVALSAAPSGLVVPASVTIPTGHQSASFNLSRPENTVLFDTTTYQVTASQGALQTTQPIQSLDNDAPQPFVITLPSFLLESGASSSGTISLPSSYTAGRDIVITLTSSNPDSLIVQQEVSIPVGQNSATFTITPQDNAQKDGMRTVTITAQATSFTDQQKSLVVRDDEPHRFSFAPIPTQQWKDAAVPLALQAFTIDDTPAIVSGNTELTAHAGGNPLSFSASSPVVFVNGAWQGTLVFTQSTSDVVVTANHPTTGISTSSNAFSLGVGSRLAITPAAISTVAVQAGPAVVETIQLSNPGVATTNWSATVSYSSQAHAITLPSALSALNAKFSSITSLIPNLYQFTDGVTGTSISDGGNDMYDGGNFLSTNLNGTGSFLAYSDNAVISSAALGSEGAYFTRKHPGLFVFAADVADLSHFQITGNLGANGNGSTNTTILTSSRGGTSYKGFVKRVYNAGDPSVNHLIIVQDQAGLSHEASSNTDDGYHKVSGLSATTRIYYLLYASAAGGYVNDTQTQAIMDAFLDSITSSWVQLSSTSGSVQPGATSPLQVTLDHSTLLPGIHQAKISIPSNDVARPAQEIPLSLRVYPAVHTFAFAPVPEFVTANIPFPVQVTALDAKGEIIPVFNGDVTLRAEEAVQEKVSASGTVTHSSVFPNAQLQSRTQIIYTPSEVGDAGQIQKIAMQLTSGGGTYNNFTIRMKHTARISYTGNPTWETGGWTTIYREKLSLGSPGWFTLPLQTPFDYDGTSHLMVDITFDNSTGSGGSYLYHSSVNPIRSLHMELTTRQGDPREWTGPNPGAMYTSEVPNMRFTKSTAVPSLPTTLSFVNGEWSENVTVQKAAPALNLVAHLANEWSITGKSNLFSSVSTGTLVFDIPSSVTEGQTIQATVSVSSPAAADLVITLQSSDSTKANVPAQLLLPAGETSVPFPITFTEDLVIKPSHTWSLTATSPGLDLAAATLIIQESVPTNLSVTLPTSIGENAAPLVNGGTVTLSGTAGVDLPIQLTSSDTTELLVPAQIIIPAGQSAVTFTLTPVNDTLIENAQTVVVTAIASSLNAPPATASITVTDDEPHTLSISLLQGSFNENAGTFVGAGGISLPGTTAEPIVVQLTSSDTTEISNTTVTIPKGVSSANFNLTIVNDTEFDGIQIARLTATSPSFTSIVSGDITVLDDDLHHFVVSPVGSPKIRNQPFDLTLSARDVNNEVLTFYNNSPTLTAQDGTKTLAITPLFVTGFSGGQRTVSVTIDDFATNAVITATDPASGGASSSNSFIVKTAPPNHFTWSTIPTPVSAGQPFQATITARNQSGSVAHFNGEASLSVISEANVGSATGTMSYPANAYYCVARTQVIYTAAELGGAGSLQSLALNFTSLPPVAMSNFTIRMKHVTKADFSGTGNATWESTGWTVCHAATLSITSAGWRTIEFTTPFEMNGTQNVMVDFSFTNSTNSFSNGGHVRSTSDGSTRTIYQNSSSNTSAPLSWSGTSPSPSTSTSRPDIRIRRSAPIPSPAVVGPFSDGSWSGLITLPAAATNIRLQALYETASGLSGVFDVAPHPALTISLPASASESSGSLSGTIILNSASSQDLIVTLSSSDTSEVTLPTNAITIPAGTLSAPFTASIVDDAESDGDQTATLTATATTYLSAAATVTVLDNDPHHFNFATVPTQRRNVPFSVTITARSASDALLAGYIGSASTLTATSGSSTLPLTPATTGTFIAGSWTGDLNINQLASNVILTTQSPNGITGSSNAFAVTSGPATRFVWTTPPTAPLGTSIPTTLTAVDVNGDTATTFNGTANLSVANQVTSSTTIGNGSVMRAAPLYLSQTDVRSQIIYQRKELGPKRLLTGLSLNVATVSASTFNNLTLRLRHTTRQHFNSTPLWETTDWTTVWAGSRVFNTTGWVNFAFTTPFEYNGTDNLMLDISSDNEAAGTSVNLYGDPLEYDVGMIHFYGSTFGNPLHWSGDSQSRYASVFRPQVQWNSTPQLPTLSPTVTGTFISGIWSGHLTLNNVSPHVVLQATASGGVSGHSQPLSSAYATPSLAAEPPFTGGLSNSLSWTTSLGASGYVLETATTNAFTSPLSTETENLTGSANALQDGVTYHYRVRGVAPRETSAHMGEWQQDRYGEFMASTHATTDPSLSLHNVTLAASSQSATTQTEAFDTAGTGWATTLFSALSQAASNYTQTVMSTGPNTTPPLPINQGGDLEGTIYCPSNIPYYALPPYSTADRFADGSIEGYLWADPSGAYKEVSLLIRAQPTAMTALNAYQASAIIGSNAVQFRLRCLVGNVVHDLGSPSITTSLSTADNLKVKLSAQGNLLTLQAWKVSVVNNAVQETPILLENGSPILARNHDAYSIGQAGIHFTASGHYGYYDDVTITKNIPVYASSGSVTSPLIAPAYFTDWDVLQYTLDSAPNGTSGSVDVLDANQNLLASNVPSGTVLSTLPAVASQRALRLRAHLATTNSSRTPSLRDWRLGYTITPAGRATSAWSNSVSSTQDATPPVISVEALTTTSAAATLTGSTTDATSGLATVNVNGTPPTTTNSFANWTSSQSGLAEGSNAITVTASDNAVPPNTSTVTTTIYRIANPDGDSNQNSIPSLLEHAFGIPDNSTSPRSLLPAVSTTTDAQSGQRHLTLQYRRRIQRNGLQYLVETSTNLTQWSSTGTDIIEQSTTPTGDDLTETVVIRITPAIPLADAKFVRLRVVTQ